MTKEVQLGGQTVKLRATGSLPLAYRVLFNRDLLRDMDNWREQLRARLEEAEGVAEVAETDAPEGVAGETEAAAAAEVTEEAPAAANEILYTMDIALIARLAYAMAKSAEPSIPGSMTEWLDTLESPNALYILTGEVLQLYNNGFETTVEAKKNIPPLPAP